MPMNLDSLKSFLTEAWSKMIKPFLLLYFVIIAVLSAYFTCTLWLAAPPEKPADAKPPKAECKDVQPDTPKISQLDPSEVAIGENYANVTIFGCNFKEGSTTRFNGLERKGSLVSVNELIVPLQASDFAAPGNIAVSVENKDSANKTLQSAAANLRIKSASDIKAIWPVWPFEKPFPINPELRLILLVLFTGGFAGAISGLKSFVDFVGEKKFDPSWFLLYLADPVVGSGIALVFYLVLRGGLLAGTNVDVKAVKPYGFVAVAALVGLFSDDALMKLNEVARKTIFKPKVDDTRSGKLSDPPTPPDHAG